MVYFSIDHVSYLFMVLVGKGPINPFSWKDKHLFSFILDEVLCVNNKRNQLKSKGLKVYSSKQSMKVLGVSKPKYINSG